MERNHINVTFAKINSLYCHIGKNIREFTLVSKTPYKCDDVTCAMTGTENDGNGKWQNWKMIEMEKDRNGK